MKWILLSDKHPDLCEIISEYLSKNKEIIDQKTQNNTFEQTASTIMQYNPAERDPMFEFLISVAMSDNELFTMEIDFLYEVGANLFKFSAKEIAQKISYVVRGNFLPKLY